MRITLLIYNVFCILMVLGCTDNHASTSLPSANINDLNSCAENEDKSIVLQLMSCDTMALPVGKVDVVMINNTDSAYTTGKYYRIERFENNGWIEIPRKFGSFEDIGYIIKPNGGKRSFTINLRNVQHTYQKGIYRICKEARKGGNKYYLYCTFYIK
jgi:hypothetical protein